eukprot:5045997-Pyramimonas_sp.AAC.1
MDATVPAHHEPPDNSHHTSSRPSRTSSPSPSFLPTSPLFWDSHWQNALLFVLVAGGHAAVSRPHPHAAARAGSLRHIAGRTGSTISQFWP